MNGSQPATIELHCACGERRVVPAGLRIVSCIKCGQALGPPLPTTGPRPALFLLAVAAHSTQLVSGIALGLAVAWAARGSGASVELFAWLSVPIVGFFAGGKAYRTGSVGALLLGEAVNAVIAAMCMAGRDHVTELLHVSGVVPHLTHDAKLLTLATAAFAGIACLMCLAAVPQARRYAEWRRSRIALAVRTGRF